MADIVQSADVRMVQRRYGPGFAVETLFGLGIVRQMARQDLVVKRAQRAMVCRWDTSEELLTAVLPVREQLSFVRSWGARLISRTT